MAFDRLWNENVILSPGSILAYTTSTTFDWNRATWQKQIFEFPPCKQPNDVQMNGTTSEIYLPAIQQQLDRSVWEKET